MTKHDPRAIAGASLLAASPGANVEFRAGRRRLRDRLLAASIVAAALAGAAAPVRADWRGLSALEAAGARVSASVVDLTNDSVIQQLHADERLTPASVTKVLVAAAALNTWAADKMFQTRLVSTGLLRDGVIHGDVVLVGAGDPSLSDENLWTLAAQVRAAGVRSVTGQLVVAPAPFGLVGCETKDRCEAGARGDTAYNAPIASIGVDYGNWCVDVRSNPAGGPAVISGCGVAHLPVPVTGTVTTVGAGRAGSPWVERATDGNGQETLHVGGSIASGGAIQMYRSMSNPALGAGQLMKESLREMGVEVSGGVVVREGAVPRGAFPLAQVQGLSIKEQLGRMLRFSNNYIADVLTLTMAADISSHPPRTLAEAGNVLAGYVQRTTQRMRRGGGSPPVLRSGSGLTPENAISANEVVSVLAAQYRNTRDFGAYYGGFVVPRQAPFAFLRSGSSMWLDRVALKPGTMDDPHSVCGIAGYLRKKDGGWMAFAVLVNGGERIHHIPLYKAMEAIHTDIDQVLAHN